ncbi:hypothetical protein [Nonomuraea sp. NPDC049625]|uniref:hypothetical protein n=1 Tax=Nonomuraea sp. NPDC049625 TaxID=3155775 RepID=UPI00342CC003
MDEILSDAGIQTVRTGTRMPRMNAVMERWVQSCRRELLDRCLIWNERHLGTPCASTNTSTTSAEPTKPGLKGSAAYRPRSDHGSEVSR